MSGLISRESLIDIVNLGLVNELGMNLFRGGKQDIVLWLNEYEMRGRAHNWDNEVMFRKFPLYLEGIPNDWYFVYVTCGGAKSLKNWDELRVRIEDYFLPSGYRESIRNELRARVQKIGESAQDYLIQKHALCLRLDREMQESRIIEWVIEGLDPEIAEQVIIYEPLEIDTLVELIKRIERGKFLNNSVLKEALDKGRSKDILDMKRQLESLTSTVRDICIGSEIELDCIDLKSEEGSKLEK